MRLRSFSETPLWRRNEFITHGYRPETESYVLSLKTWFMVHNETGNIWSHLMGALLMSILSVHKLNCSSDNFRPSDRFVFISLFMSCIFCFLMSSLFHTFACHSRRVYKLFAKLDYMGISLVMMSAGSVCFYYGFYYRPFFQSLYIWMFCIYCTLSLIFTYIDKFSDPEYHTIRAILFLMEGFFAFVPFFHLFLNTFRLERLIAQRIFKGMYLMLLSGTVNLFAAIIFIYKFPERLKPGLFNIWFSSHQMFHVLHIVASIVYYHGINLLADVQINQTVPNNTYLKLNSTNQKWFFERYFKYD